MRKSGLKTGMLVELRNRERAWVLKGTDDGDWIHWGDGRCLELRKYNEDMTYGEDCFNPESYDIIKIYNPTGCKHLSISSINEMPIIYERKKSKEISKDEAFKVLSEYFGCDIKITQ